MIVDPWEERRRLLDQETRLFEEVPEHLRADPIPPGHIRCLPPPEPSLAEQAEALKADLARQVASMRADVRFGINFVGRKMVLMSPDAPCWRMEVRDHRDLGRLCEPLIAAAVNRKRKAS